MNLADLLRDVLDEHYRDPEAHPVLPGEDRAALYSEFWDEEPPEVGIGHPAALEDVRERVLPASVRTWHPLFLNQMFSGPSLPAVVEDCFASLANPTLATWEAAPAATVIERNVLAWMARAVGLPKGAGGIFLPGGSLANLFGLAVARQGRQGGQVLCSEAAHYSLETAAQLLGVELVRVGTDERLQLRPDDFAARLEDCRDPFAVVFTAGITVTGGVDPVGELIPLCRERGLHVHVDAAFGGGLALSERGQALRAGLARVDSLTWDVHKWLPVPLPCSALLVPDPEVLRATFDRGADYLLHDEDDLGRFTPLCAKRFDGLKLWVEWRARGTVGLREAVESRLTLADRFYALLAEAPDFEPCYEPVSPIQCFRYLPAGVEEPDALQERVRAELLRRRLAFVNLATLRGRRVLRVILNNPLTTEAHLRGLLDMIREL